MKRVRAVCMLRAAPRIWDGDEGDKEDADKEMAQTAPYGHVQLPMMGNDRNICVRAPNASLAVVD